ncbi:MULTISPECIES: HAMP domain-containing sensor histidine kinase [Janthinobacterium]|uniref:histidine kinase n=1 Tax=Janthinobacterium kumbetense TaxID=2950280 RepID=A0ABT0WPS1_9BURK|nr:MULTISPECIES: ATP-binding protein [Janthinobacterium]MCM2566049.1 ATP-binding protein [Janthinobacterium kumbetense]MDN2704213.1 ATP-binding protein [Janthinobacterium sp. SUN100]MDO8041488.1 ATP-binding protein [Janthinobacterium sp. SUN137]MDO8049106.1 ATP-binding protein [Janthinobacterium sp. SUN211]MDO8067729.1 ATP-binding protein [Janthinobacterium sp. SUN206]
MSRLSFRQLLFAAFILTTGILTATSVQALLTLEHLARLGRETAAQAIALTEQSQRLSERTLAMERSARQFLVLDDPVFRERYAAARDEATAALQVLNRATPEFAPQLADEWTVQAQAAWEVLQAGKRRKRDGHAVVYRAFARMTQINDSLARESKTEIGSRNDALLAELERQRRLLGVLVGGAVLLAAVLATCFGFLLSRPLRRIETAIERLGDKRYDQPIVVGGPADTRRLGQQLDWLRQRLADLDADKERFLRHISHELKTPLAALREGVALLEDEVAGKLSDGQREIAGILQQNTASLQTQIEDLLRYNTAAFDAQHLARSKVDLLVLLQDVVAGQRLQWLARRLTVEVQGASLIVQADRDKLATALANLLSNAVRFSPEGGTVRFTLSGEGGRVRIDCTDEGAGVAPEDAARIFEPFYQGVRQAAGARNGNGIGLSIVREYIAAHDGSVTLLPRPAGAHFRIELPL